MVAWCSSQNTINSETHDTTSDPNPGAINGTIGDTIIGPIGARIDGTSNGAMGGNITNGAINGPIGDTTKDIVKVLNGGGAAHFAAPCCKMSSTRSIVVE